MSDDETVKVDLGDDYYQGAYFSVSAAHLDYEIPRSQLERWEAARAAHEAMQDEIEQVMREQMQRAVEARLKRNSKLTVAPAVQAAYEGVIRDALKQQLAMSDLFNRLGGPK